MDAFMLSNIGLRYYLRITCLIRCVTAIIKMIGCFSNKIILDLHDPLFVHFSMRGMLLFAATLELTVAMAILCERSTIKALRYIFWLANIFLLYRLGLHMLGGTGPCACLSFWLPISSSVTNVITRTMLYFMIIGSSAGLIMKYIPMVSKRFRHSNVVF